MNSGQIRSAVPEIFHVQTEKSQTAPKTEPYAVPACGSNQDIDRVNLVE